jgi:ATP-binding cassette subfamily C protein CydC
MKSEKLLTQSFAQRRLPLAGSTLLSLATIGASMGLLASSGWLITKAASHPSIAALSVSIVGVRFFGLSRAAFRYVERLYSHHISLDAITSLRLSLIQKISNTHPSPLANHGSSELVGRIVHDVDALNDYLLRCVLPLAALAAGCILFWGVLALVSLPLCAAIASSQLLISIAIPVLFSALRHKQTTELDFQRSQLRTLFGNTMLLRNDIASTGTRSIHQTKLSRDASETTLMRSSIQKLASVQNAMGTFAGPLNVALVIMVCAPLVSQGSMEGTTLAALAFATLGSFEFFAPVGAAITQLLESRSAARRLEDIVSPESTSKQDATLPCDNSVIAELDAVSFRYANSHQDALHNFSARFPIHALSTIRGHSGCGKSTLVNLLAGLHSPTEGTVKLSSLYTEGLPTVRDRDHIFSASLRENLLLGKPDATDDNLILALQTADMGSWLSQLPEGLDTLMGECGNSVSGGERQRILLARSLLPQHQVLIMDECTAHLPENHEGELLQKLTQEKSVIFVGHRNGVASLVQHSFTLEDGILVENHAR